VGDGINYDKENNRTFYGLHLKLLIATVALIYNNRLSLLVVVGLQTH
jgi:hypothetical protein